MRPTLAPVQRCACSTDQRECARCSGQGLITQRDEGHLTQGADRRLGAYGRLVAAVPASTPISQFGAAIWLSASFACAA